MQMLENFLQKEVEGGRVGHISPSPTPPCSHKGQVFSF